MNFSNLIRRVAGAGLPLLGQALAGPAGRTVAAMIGGALGLETDNPDEIEAALAADPDRLADLRELETRQRHDLEMFAEQAAAQAIETVNAQMGVEARAEDAWSRRWRPFWGFTSAAAFFVAIGGVLVLVFSIAWSGNWDALSAVPPIVNAFMILFTIPGAILGVTAWHRGKMQRIRAGEIGAEQGRGVFDMWRAVRRDDTPTPDVSVPTAHLVPPRPPA